MKILMKHRLYKTSLMPCQKGNWKGYHGVLMPKFNDKLTQQDTKTIAKWILNE